MYEYTSPISVLVWALDVVATKKKNSHRARIAGEKLVLNYTFSGSSCVAMEGNRN